MLKRYKKYGDKVEIVPIKCSKSTILILVLNFSRVLRREISEIHCSKSTIRSDIEFRDYPNITATDIKCEFLIAPIVCEIHIKCVVVCIAIE